MPPELIDADSLTSRKTTTHNNHRTTECAPAVSGAIDVYCAGMAGFEAAAHIELPRSGALWAALRHVLYESDSILIRFVY